MIRLLVRLGAIAVAALVIFMAHFSWTFGTPPTWTLFGERQQSVVLATSVHSGPVGNGTTRYTPVIMVEWPGAPDGVQLGGVIPDFAGYGKQLANDLIADYPVGDPLVVRVYEGAPFADRTSWFGLAHAVFLSVFAVLLSGVVWVVWRVTRPAR